ncbi:MAG: T9SS type A sorting domain-containing protein [bacterium]|nr:T9SS type A sorting domain-containing protein [bacterium]
MRFFRPTLFILLFVVTTAHAVDSLRVRQLGTLYHTWGGVSNIRVRGNYAYCITGFTGLSVFDLRNSDSLLEVGSIPSDKIYLESVLDSNYLFYSLFDGFQIVDISQPTLPQVIYTLDLPYFVYDIDKQGNFVYLANDTCGVRILNVSNPSLPVEVGRYRNGRSITDVSVFGNYAYLAESPRHTLSILDISQPTNPVLVDTLPDWGGKFEFRDTLAFGVCNYGLTILSVSNPATPTFVNRFTFDMIQRIALTRNYVIFKASSYSSLWALNVSDPLSLGTPIQYRMSTEYSTRLAVSDSNLLFNSYGNITRASIVNPEAPVVRATYTTMGYLFSCENINNTLYIGTQSAGVRIVDCSDRAHCTEIDTMLPNQDVTILKVRDNRLFVSIDHNGIDCYDVSIPNQPVHISRLNINGDVCDLAFNNNLCYVSRYNNGVSVYDVTNIASPQYITFINTPGNARAVDYSNGYIYVANSDSNVTIYDASTYLERCRFLVDCHPNDLLVSGNILYTASLEYGLQAFDVNDPIHPNEVGRCNLRGKGISLKKSGNFLFVACSQGGLQIIDITDPEHPLTAGYYDSDGLLWEIAVDGNFVYGVNFSHLAVFDCAEALPVVDRTISSPPVHFALHSNFPNPFNATTTITYDVPQTSPVRLAIYDVTGKEVAKLIDFHQDAGRYSVQWDAQAFASGTYFCRLQAGSQVQTRKLMLLK